MSGWPANAGAGCFECLKRLENAQADLIADSRQLMQASCDRSAEVATVHVQKPPEHQPLHLHLIPNQVPQQTRSTKLVLRRGSKRSLPEDSCASTSTHIATAHMASYSDLSHGANLVRTAVAGARQCADSIQQLETNVRLVDLTASAGDTDQEHTASSEQHRPPPKRSKMLVLI